VPRTAQDVRALRIKLQDLRDALQDAATRRRNISEQLPNADPAARPGIEARLAELDSRIVGIERNITVATQQLAAAPAVATIGAAPTRPEDILNRVGNDLVPIVAILSVFVLGPFSLAMARLVWKRGSSAPARAAVSDAATQNRLEALQQSVDAIALEVERISEGQRFVTKLLSERDRALGAGAAEPVRAANRAVVPNERG
jgi:hypothetical protein